MTVTITGNFLDQRATLGDYYIGESALGQIDVTAGSVFSVTAPAGQESSLQVGRFSGGNGIVNITGAGSIVDVVGTGLTSSSGAFVNIGRTAVGSTSTAGSMTVTNGGTLRIRDSVGTTYNWSSADGAESLTIGREAGATGSLTLNAGNVEVIGTGAFLNSGRNNASGTMSATNGSTIVVRSTIATAEAGWTIGRDAAAGTAAGLVTLDASSAVITSGGAAASGGETYSAFMNVGRGSTTTQGTLTLQNNATLTMNGINAALGTTGGSAFMAVGRGGGNGTINVLSGSDMVLNGGTEGAFVDVGRGGAGVAGDAATGSVGLLRVSGAGSSFLADTTGNTSINLGRFAGNSGTLTVENGASFAAVGNTFANLNVGFRFGGDTGNGGTGILNVLSGAIMTVESQSTVSTTGLGFLVGSYQGNGTVTVDAATLRLVSSQGISTVIGGNFEFATIPLTGGTGTLRVQNGGLLEMIDGSVSGSMVIGRGANSNALVEVLSGGRIDIDDDAVSSTNLSIGDRIGTASATLRISGANSVFEGANFVTVGQDAFNTSTSTGGNGRLIVENGGVFRGNNNVNIGSGGILSGHNGTIDLSSNMAARVILAGSGQIGDSAGAIQTMTIQGGLTAMNGVLRVDVGAGSTNHDRVNISGQLGLSLPPGAASSETSVQINTVGGYQFVAGETRTLMTQASTFIGATTAINATVTGQAAGFAYLLGVTGANGNSLVFEALNSGATAGAAVLDFGATSAVSARLVYNSIDREGSISGGRFWANGSTFTGAVYGLSEVRGTDLDDVFNIGEFGGTGTTPPGFSVFGRGGNDTLSSGIANDTIDGGSGNDLINGSGGSDTLNGGGDTDQVRYLGFGTADMTVYLDGAAGQFVIKSGPLAGTDTLIGIEAVTGSNGNNIYVLKNAVYDVTGGTGNDIYIVDNAASSVSEASNGGYDVVFSGASFTSNGNIEYIRLDAANTAATDLSATGSVVMEALAGGTTMSGGASNNLYVVHSNTTIINDTGGNNTILAYATVTMSANINTTALLASNASVFGNSADNVIQSFGTGTTLVGGGGNDLYQISSATSTVTEVAGQGFDVLWSLASDYTLPTNVEFLLALASGATIRSNAAGGILAASNTNNTLVTGAGNDTLYGNGLGTTFKFFGAGGANFGNDVVGVFTPSVDKLDFSGFGLAGLSGLTLTGGTSGAVPITTITINGNATSSVLLYGNTVGTLTAADFLF